VGGKHSSSLRGVVAAGRGARQGHPLTPPAARMGVGDTGGGSKVTQWRAHIILQARQAASYKVLLINILSKRSIFFPF
jgi:hypothetical protein